MRLSSAVTDSIPADPKLRQTLLHSHQEAAVSAVMTSTGDNFLNALGIFFQASAMQLSLLMAIPQLVGAMLQFLSVWLVHYVRRKTLVVVSAVCQSLIVLLIAGLAASSWQGELPRYALIVLAILYHSANFIIQPHWRAWMGGLVPQPVRGVFFAARTKITMATSLTVFVLGGGLLTLCERWHWTALGFSLLFVCAALGRLMSALLFAKMHDPDPHPVMSDMVVIQSSMTLYRQALKDKTFRDYSLFVAGMQGMVAISAPFFAVHMLSELNFSYLEFCLNSMMSVAIQFLTLSFWGRVSDRFGNRLVMIVTSCVIPILPLAWLFSVDFYYLLGVQVLSGLAWGGFSLSTGNYLYDIRPHGSQFAVYAALQSAIGALLIFIGSLLGGVLGNYAPQILSLLPINLGYATFVLFISSAILRTLVAVWFLPRLHEPHVRPRPKVLTLVFRVARFSLISGAVFDWLTVVKRTGSRRR